MSNLHSLYVSTQ